MAGDKTVLVVGGGISGITAAVEAAEAGCKVILVERLPYLGGRVAQIEQVLSEAVSSHVRPGDQFQKNQKKPRYYCLHLAEVESISGPTGELHRPRSNHPAIRGRSIQQRSNVLKIVL